jgi:hypothetical protein
MGSGRRDLYSQNEFKKGISFNETGENIFKIHRKSA